MCFWPQLATPSNKSAQMALGWHMWFPVSLGRTVEGLAPKDSSNLPSIGICPKSCDSVGVLQPWGDKNTSLCCSFLWRVDGWLGRSLRRSGLLCATPLWLPAGSEQPLILHLCPCLQLQNEPDRGSCDAKILTDYIAYNRYGVLQE